MDVGGTAFTGSVFAKSIQVVAGTQLTFEAAPWAVITGQRSPGTIPLAFGHSPVLLVARNDHLPTESTTIGSSSPTAPVQFQIPARIAVGEGNAGNFPAVISFTIGGTTVTCQYKGGASIAHPTDQLDVAKGYAYLFQSCSNGLAAGATATGTNFTPTIKGDPQAVGAATVAKVGFGGGCDADLEAPITAADSVTMVRGFDWTKTKALPETTPDGHPTLYYANIYIRNDKERQLLDKFRIHWQKRPMFDSEMANFSGQCGTISYRDDGEGMFVFAFIPGKTYNRLREATSSSQIRPEQRIVFKAIILRQPPAAALGTDGSLSYQALENAGFYYLGVRQLPSDAALDDTNDFSGGAVAEFADIVEFVAEVANDVAQEVTVVLGAIDRFLQGSVTVTVDVDVLNRDGRFVGPPPVPGTLTPNTLTRGWGPFGPIDSKGQPTAVPISVPGVKIEIMQWAQRIYTLGLPLPTKFTGYTNQNGTVSIKVSKGGDGFGGGTSSRGSSGLCVELLNSAAKVTSFLVEDEVCDFPVIDPKNPTDTNNTVLGSFEHDGEVAIQSDDGDLVSLAEISDSQSFYGSVVGGPWRRAKVLRGANASALSVANKSAWTPCLGFGSGTADAAVTSALALPVVGPALSFYLALFGNVDMILPPSSNAFTNRGIATHESGHYALCNLVNQSAGPAAIPIFSLLQLQTIQEGSTIDLGDEARILNEAFADFFASEVVSGANYWAPTNSDPGIQGSNINFCNGTLHCLDANDSSSGSGPARDEMKKLGTILHDAFDGHPKGQLAPTNGDAWSSPSPTTVDSLVFTPTSYGDDSDEVVQLGGPKLQHVVDHFISNSAIFSIAPFEKGLAQTIYEENTWCQACTLFSLHEGLPVGTPARDQWNVCVGPALASILGPPPSPSLNMDPTTCCPLGTVQQNNVCVACASNQISVGNACITCPGVQVADRATNTCLTCPPGQTNVSGACVACPDGQISQGNACVACALGKGANRATPATIARMTS